MSDFPFSERKIDENTIIRKFRGDVDTEELVWHRDRRHRVIQVLESRGWFFQRDDELPTPMSEGDSFLIPARSWHRAIKRRGSGDLVIKITEFDS